MNLTFKPGTKLIVAGLVLAVCFPAIWSLKINTDIANLLPENNPHVLAARSFERKAGGEVSFEVAIKGPDFKSNVRFAESFSALLMHKQTGNNRLILRADIRNDVQFIESRFLYFLTIPELDGLENELRTGIQNAKRRANPFLFELEESEEIPGAALAQVPDLETFRYFLNLPPEYRVNADSTVLVISLIPARSISDLSYLNQLDDALSEAAEETRRMLGDIPVEVIPARSAMGHYDQIRTIQDELSRAALVSVFAVLLFLGIYLKLLHSNLKWRSAKRLAAFAFPVITLAVPPLFAVVVTYAAAYFILGNLNLLTSALIGILFGLNVDFSMHVLSRYVLSSVIHGHRGSILEVYRTSGQAVFWSGMTTSLAMGALLLSEFKGFNEFGILAAIGLFINLLTTFFVLVPLLSWFRKFVHPVTGGKAIPEVPNIKSRLGGFSWSIVLATLLCAYSIKDISFEYELSKLEPRNRVTSAFNQITAGMKSGFAAPSFFVPETFEEAQQIHKVVETKIKEEALPVQYLESLSSRIPLDETAAAEKRQRIERIAALLDDPFARGAGYKLYDEARSAANNATFIPISSLPPFIQSRITGKDGNPLPLVMIVPSENLGDGRKSIRFKQLAGEITLPDGTNYYAASLQMVAASVLEILQNEFYVLIGVPMLVSFIVMLIEFRTFGWALLSFMPLLAGSVLLFGSMSLLGWKFNLYNMLVLPIVLGVGDDAGIHFATHFRFAGHHSISTVLRTTGVVVAASSLTTVLGFTGMLVIDHRGLESLGATAFLGVLCTLLASIAVIPAMKWLSHKEKSL